MTMETKEIYKLFCLGVPVESIAKKFVKSEWYVLQAIKQYEEEQDGD